MLHVAGDQLRDRHVLQRSRESRQQGFFFRVASRPLEAAEEATGTWQPSRGRLMRHGWSQQHPPPRSSKAAPGEQGDQDRQTRRGMEVHAGRMSREGPSPLFCSSLFPMVLVTCLRGPDHDIHQAENHSLRVSCSLSSHSH